MILSHSASEPEESVTSGAEHELFDGISSILIQKDDVHERIQLSESLHCCVCGSA